MRSLSIFDKLVIELESKVNEGIQPSKWEIGSILFKEALSTGLFKRITPGSFTLFNIPVSILNDQPETLRLLGEKINAKK